MRLALAPKVVIIEVDRAVVGEDTAIIEEDRAAVGEDRAAVEVDTAIIEVDRAVAGEDRVVAEVDRAVAGEGRAAVEVGRAAVEVGRAAVEVDTAIIEVDRVVAGVDRVVAGVDRAVAGVDRVVAEVDRAVAVTTNHRRYFSARRVFGIDHFDEAYRSMPFVRKGIFRFTRNGMYTYGFLLLWAPALWYASLAALCVALFNHIYIWVHYYSTELPDMRHISGKTRSVEEDGSA